MKFLLLCAGILTGLFLTGGCASFKAPRPAESVAVKAPQKKVAPPKSAVPLKEAETISNYQRALLLVQTMEMLRKNYVDGKKVSYEELFNHAMRGMVSALDPYSDYEPPREFRHQQVRRTGTVVGIGATAVKPHGRPLTLIRVLPGSPAESAGLHAGDQITAIDGIEVRKYNLSQALEKLKGAPDSQVRLKIRRGSQIIDVTVTRNVVRHDSVVPGSVKLISGKIGYIKLTSFTLRSGIEMEKALQTLRSLGAQGIILDLRNNPGGLVKAAVHIASLFLPENTVVFRARSRAKKDEQTVLTLKGKSFDTSTPLVIITNAFSASCSEILTGALQDHKRAKVLGVRTFGKGTILSVVQVPGGGAVRYASAYYVTPGGRVIEQKGIIPDVELRISTAEVLRLSSQTLRYPGELKPPHKGTIPDRQLQGAVTLLQQQLKNEAPQK